ncbi:hypothetical protein [Nostoc sp. UHCC 0251]|uniref:hypothetical protein n=1 Tax=Nostoc sp. UHCC 0251 TaxID=3110240 RepID=UPI002B1E9284|nr:hypothetical protein [Nostoc sp. UHCC 0251]MEA5626141.1 hypothetical protein [Nostoc sp. UHCC 0251]
MSMICAIAPSPPVSSAVQYLAKCVTDSVAVARSLLASVCDTLRVRVSVPQGT